jgi:hypothetical protein
MKQLRKLTIKILVATFFISITALLNCCHKDEPCLTCPPDIEPGRRDYTWYIDTVQAGGNFMNGIDGVLPNDVWAVTIPGDFSKTLFHFDGTKWTTDGINRSFSPQVVRAFTSNNVWSVGAQGDIWQYDGNQWRAQARLTVNNYFIALESIDGDSPTNLYTSGTFFDSDNNLYALIYHLNGNIWSRVNIQDTLCTLYKIRFYGSSKALIMGSTHVPDGSAPDSSKIFTFDGLNLNEIYSARENYLGRGNFARIPGGDNYIKRNAFDFLRWGPRTRYSRYSEQLI